MRNWCSNDVGDWRCRCPLDDGDWFGDAFVDVMVVDFAYEFKLFKLLLLKLSIEWLVLVIKKLSFWCELLRLIPFSLNNLINQSYKKNVKHEHEHKIFFHIAKRPKCWGLVINYKMVLCGFFGNSHQVIFCCFYVHKFIIKN